MNSVQVDELIGLLQHYELSIARLYESYASILPDLKNEWLAFAKEERLHAQWIDTLHIHLKNEKISFDQQKFTVQSIRLAIDYVKKQADQVVQNKPDFIQCLNTAVNIEKSLLESAFFKVFKLEGPKAQNIKNRLEKATQAHLDKLIQWRKDTMGND